MTPFTAFVPSLRYSLPLLSVHPSFVRLQLRPSNFCCDNDNRYAMTPATRANPTRKRRASPTPPSSSSPSKVTKTKAKMNPKKAKADTKTTTKATTKATGVKRATSKQQDKQEEQQQQQYFLMKSEPESRIQNGQEMKFSIDDLIKEPDSTTHWDGVRNYEARNIMKEMNIGDRAFFYHSNCKKSQPAIVGQVEIVRQAYPDHTAFDREDVHFDPKSDKKNPKWFMVDVKFEKKFKQEVTLKDVKDCAQLQNMQLVKRGRISVQRVTPREWTSVLKMAGEPVPDDGDDDDDGSEEEEDDDENDDE